MKHLALILILGILTVFPSSLNQSHEKVYGDTYSFVIPEGWRIVSETEVKTKIDQLKNDVNIVLPKFDFALVLENSTTLFEREFIIVRTNNDGKIPKSGIDQFITIDDKQFNELKQTIDDYSHGIISVNELKKQFFNKRSKVVYYIFQSEVESFGYTIQIQAWLLTETGYIQLIGSFPQEDFIKRINGFFGFIDSFNLDNKYK
jgi:hypothetical protein